MGLYTEPVDAPFAELIDADLFTDDDGSLYFYSTRWPSGEECIYCRTALDPWTLTGSYSRLISPSGWEVSNINEASKAFKYRDRYYMLYNSHVNENTGDNYCIGCIEADGPAAFSNGGKYPAPVLMRTTPSTGGEITRTGQPWVAEGPNGFERWIGYFAVHDGFWGRYIDRIHFFDHRLYVDGPTNRYSEGYHPGPAHPTLLSLFNIPDGPMPPEDWTPISDGTWEVLGRETRQSDQNTFSFNTVNRTAAANYLIEANVKFDAPPDSEDKCGVLACFFDWDNWMIVGLDRSNGNWYYHLKEGGVDKVAGGVYPAGFDWDAYHTIRVERNSSSFKIRIDDKLPPNCAGTVGTGFTTAATPGLYADHSSAVYDGVIYTVGWDEWDGNIEGWGQTLGGVQPSGAGAGIHDHYQDGLIPGCSFIRLKRLGDSFDGYYSPDGVNWTLLGSVSTPQISDSCYIGFAVTSHNNDRVCGAEFDSFTLEVPVSRND